ncbi:MAG: ATP-dependent Clp protease ATP-binding subunit [Lachnospiraceae bacterium]|jgi:ATP-dependent Clp protease ATP-binding subunit ClpC|nr:ATP-dependent Clp protease ATP-binding subunit [Lachnospiraceae bacterium]
MQKKYTARAKKALVLAEAAAKQLEHNYIGTEHLIVGLLTEGQGTAARVMYASEIDRDKIMDLISEVISPKANEALLEQGGYTPRATRVLEGAWREADKFGSDSIGTEHILIAILRDPECVGTRLLLTLGISPAKMYVDILSAMGEDVHKYSDEFKGGRFPQKKATGSATPMLDQYSRDLTVMASKGKLEPCVERDKEIERIIQILSRRNKNNPCLIGEPGVGKTAIVEGIAQRITDGLVPDTLMGKRVVSLDMSGMVAGSKYRGEFEERIKKVLREISKVGNILMFIDELHTIIGAGGAEGAIDASNILKPSLARGEIQIIGATTITEYRKYIEKDAALERRFQPVMVEEPNTEQTLKILHELKGGYEDHHNVIITDEALEAAVKYSERYINDRFFPDKAIDVIDEAASRVRLGKYSSKDEFRDLRIKIKEYQEAMEEAIKNRAMDKAKEYKELKLAAEEELKKKTSKGGGRKKKLKVTDNDVAQVVSMWSKVPVAKMEEAESKRLLKLESILHKRVVGQDEAVKAIAKAVKRGRVGLKDPGRPIGSFLLLGPTGVGKTELSKALAEAIFGTEDAIIRVDMSEYMEKHSVSKMVGSPPGYVGYEEGGQLSEKVRRNPYSVILFDEIEKAHPDVFNMLLQVLDDGHITDAQGRKIDFKNTIIIMTSNAGAQSIIEPKKLGFASVDDEKHNYERMKDGVMDEVKRIFKPEFLNRIDEIIVFRSLTKDDMTKIVTIMAKNLVDRCREQMDIELDIRDSVKKFIVEKGYDPKYGARPLKRTIQTEIEDALAETILQGKVKAGNKVTVGLKNKKITFTPSQKVQKTTKK